MEPPPQQGPSQYEHISAAPLVPTPSAPGMTGAVPPAFFQQPAAGGFPAVPVGLSSMMQFPVPMLTDVNMLSQLTGVPVKAIRENPSMAVAAQQLFAQRMLQQQMLSVGQLAQPGMLHPNLQRLQQMQMQQVQAAAAAGAGKPPGKGKGKKSSTPKKPAAPAPPRDPSLREDPGGKVIWAKVANYPWWPAKTLDPDSDLSFPTHADPPRPTAIPVRFFGTHEFVWMGSKRAIEDWEEGYPQHHTGSKEEAFTAALAEVDIYLKGGLLPDVFYTVPEPEGNRKGRKRTSGGAAPGAAGGAPAGRVGGAGNVVGTPVAGGSRVRAAKTPVAMGAEGRAAAVYARKRQRLLELGLLPPDDSPYVGGQVAPNPALLAMGSKWEAESGDVMAEARAAAPLPPPRAALPPPPKPRPTAPAAVPTESPNKMSLDAPVPFAMPQPVPVYPLLSILG